MRELARIVQQALAEDAAWDDATTAACVPVRAWARAEVRAKADGVLSGSDAAAWAFRLLDPHATIAHIRRDAEHVRAGDLVLVVEGEAQAILRAERTALNFMQHLSGIATLTRRFVEAVAGTGCRIADTRKTTPGLRALEKRAVRHGGGENHRLHLGAAVLIKENHIFAAGGITAAVQAARRAHPRAWIEVECESLMEVEEAVRARPDAILLDNMSPRLVAQARAHVPRHILLEASGGITLANARAYAEAGADRLAIGALTHSAPALDLSLRLARLEKR